MGFCFINSEETMSWFCFGREPETPPNVKIMNEYTMVDKLSHQVYVEKIDSDKVEETKKFIDWRRVKIKGKNLQLMQSYLKRQGISYVDQQFPHDNSSISQEIIKEQIEWQRVETAVPNAVFAKEHNTISLQKVQLNRREFEHALVLIGRARCQAMLEIIAKTLNREGIYGFTIFRDGVIEEVLIDDFVPTLNSSPLFLGPARNNEVYPLLLEKAIAKVCQRYENIPEDASVLMEMILCGPVESYFVRELMEQSSLDSLINKSLIDCGLTVLMSRREQKIRSLGINQNEMYHIIARHEIELENNQREHVYELLSESKISAWNGRYCLNDPIWGHIQPATKQRIFKRIKDNRSFCIVEQDIPRFFEQLFVFQNEKTKNKDWIEGHSSNVNPQIISFTLQKDDLVYLRVTTRLKIWQSLIILKTNIIGEYQLVASSFESSSRKVSLHQQLLAGSYLACIHHEWDLQKEGYFSLFLSSQSHIYLSKASPAKHTRILEKTFMKYALEKEEKQIQHQKSLYSLNVMAKHCGFAYFFIKPRNSRSKEIKLIIDQAALANNWEIMDPYSGLKEITLKNDYTQISDRILLLKVKEIHRNKEIVFPSTAFKITE